jgi:hypothetical protein
MTDEPIPRRVSLRIVRGGVRELTIGGVVMAAWLKLADGKAAGLTQDGAAISLAWGDDGRLRGSLTTTDADSAPLLFTAARTR